MIDLKFPSSTVVGKSVPKTAFYKHLEVNAKMKQHFVDDVVRIDWFYKLAPSTTNIADGKTVHEIVVFGVQLKAKDCPDDVFLFIDQNMPRHVVFVLEYEGLYKVLLNYKEWAPSTASTGSASKSGQASFRIVKTFSSEWVKAEQLTLPLQGQTMDAVYETMAGSVSGFGTTKSEDTKRIVELETLISKTNKDVEALDKKVRNERQLSRKMEMNSEVRKLKRQLASWQEELSELKR